MSSIRSKLLAAAAGLTLAGGLGLAAGAGTAMAVPATVSGVTYLSDNGDNGNGTGLTPGNGVWAYDALHRTLTVTATPTACSSGAPATCYTATVADTGTFKTIPGNGNAPNPNSTTEPGTNISYPAVTGEFSGTASYVFETNAVPSASNIPGVVDNSGSHVSTGPKSTTDWFVNAFPSATPITSFYNSAGQALAGYGGTNDNVLQPTWSWGYTTYTGASATTTAVACESWTDSSTNTDGNAPGDGNITGKQCAGTPVPAKSYTGAISNFYSAKCLSDSAAPAAGNVLVQETCDGSAAEQFVLTAGPGGQLNLEGTTLCVASNGRAAKPLRLVPCSSAVYELYRTTVVKHGPDYGWPGTGLVMDDSGASRANGATVIGYPQKAYAQAANQHWSVP